MVTIEREEKNCFTVRDGDKYAEHLTYDEMLGLVSQLMMPERRRCLEWLKTKEEWEAWAAHLKQVRETQVEPF